ncbi:hypothetical protein OKA04_14735, partial [Luteolibacter flavescens]
MISHLDELHDKYGEKGLTIIGVNVWEDGKAMVSDFVADQGDGMSYAVAFAGKGAKFETEWLKPAGAPGIPFASVVRDGKVILNINPRFLTTEVVEGLLAGGKSAVTAVANAKEAKRKETEFYKILPDFHNAIADENRPALEKAFAGLRKVAPDQETLRILELRFHVAKRDWVAAKPLVDQLSTEPAARQVISDLNSSGRLRVAPDSFKRALVAGLARQYKEESDPGSHQFLSIKQWQVGDKDGAKLRSRLKNNSCCNSRQHAPRHRQVDEG